LNKEDLIKERYSVYKHTDPEGKIYIGMSCNPKGRWSNGSGYRNQFFYEAVKKYGWNNITHEILYSDLTKEKAEKIEESLTLKYKSYEQDKGYNIRIGKTTIKDNTPKQKITVEVDPEFYHKIKVEIAKRDVTLKQYVTTLIEEDLKKK